MANLSQHAHQDVAQIHLEHAYIVLAGDKENVRASHWNRVSPRARKMITWWALGDSKKGDATLQSLTAFERGQIHFQARQLIQELQLVLRCAQGGQLVDQFPDAGHESDGIAA
jgi:hypothetical protein